MRKYSIKKAGGCCTSTECWTEDPLKRIYASKEPHSLHNFVTTSSLRFFKILKLDEQFLEHDPSEWDNLEQ